MPIVAFRNSTAINALRNCRPLLLKANEDDLLSGLPRSTRVAACRKVWKVAWVQGWPWVERLTFGNLEYLTIILELSQRNEVLDEWSQSGVQFCERQGCQTWWKMHPVLNAETRRKY